VAFPPPPADRPRLPNGLDPKLPPPQPARAMQSAVMKAVRKGAVKVFPPRDQSVG
jgi:hypothetical protein